MPLQNRVDPFGEIHAVAARGMFTGNRGVIHDPGTRTLLSRRWTTKAWIVCTCRYKDVRRDVMGRNARSGGAGWTELFFLDEVTAFAAGHRPCFACRREAAKAYAGHFAAAFGIAAPKVAEIDGRLHRERLASSHIMNAVERTAAGDLPDGAMIFDGEAAYALKGGMALRWSFEGHARPVGLDALAPGSIGVITPATTLAVLKAGYRPVWHPSTIP